jgi:peptide/nickel transport system substrate-binding protein
MRGSGRRTAVLTGAVALVAMLAAACGGGSATSSQAASAAGPPVTGGTLTFGLEGESQGYVPGMPSQIAVSGGLVESMIYDPLTELTADGTAKPFLATAVTPSADFKTWTVTLPSGVKYGVSGKTMDAQDIADDFTQYYTAPGSAIAATFAEIASVTAPGPTTAVFHLKAPDAQFATVLCRFYPFNPDTRAKYGSSYSAHPDGTGPFYIAAWHPNSEIDLKANPYYWRKDSSGRKLPYLSAITLKIIPSGATRNATLSSGGIDGYLSTEPPVLEQATKLSGVNVLEANEGGYGWFMNVTKPPLDDVRVREALAYSTDQQAIVASQGAGSIVSTMNQYYTSTSPYYDAAAGSQFPTLNVTKAKSLLAAYINDPKRSDGKPVGSPISFQLNYISGDAASSAAVQIAQQEWSALGIKVSLNSLDEAAWVSAALSGDTQVFWFEWAVSTPYLLYTHNYLPPAVNPTNWTRLDDPTVVSAINSLGECTTAACTKDGAAMIAQQFVKQLPVIFLMTSPVGYPVNSQDVGGLQLPPGAASGLNYYPDFATAWVKS